MYGVGGKTTKGELFQLYVYVVGNWIKVDCISLVDYIQKKKTEKTK